MRLGLRPGLTVLVLAFATGLLSPLNVASQTTGSVQLYLPIVINTRPVAAQPPQLLPNGDFEAGRAEWDTRSELGYEIIWNVNDRGFPRSVVPHSGESLAWLGGEDNEVSSLAQDVAVPSSQPYLSYWYRISSRQQECGFDFGAVEVDNGRDTTVVKEYDLCVENNSAVWVHEVVDLSAFAGTSVRVTISATTDDDDDTLSSLYIDDVAFQSQP